MRSEEPFEVRLYLRRDQVHVRACAGEGCAAQSVRAEAVRARQSREDEAVPTRRQQRGACGQLPVPRTAADRRASPEVAPGPIRTDPDRLGPTRTDLAQPPALAGTGGGVVSVVLLLVAVADLEQRREQ